MGINEHYIDSPQKFFTKDFQNFLKPIRLIIDTQSITFLEDDCVLAYVYSGKGTLFVNGIEFPLKAGSFCRLHSYHIFKIFPDDLHPLDMIFLTEDYTHMSYWGFFQENINTSEIDLFYFPPVINPRREIQVQIEDIFKHLLKEDTDREKQNLSIQSVLSSKLCFLFQYECHANPKITKVENPSPLWNAIIYLTICANTKATLEDTARLFHIKPDRLNQQFRQVMHMNFTQFLARARINYSCGALMLEQISLSSIAANSGFSSESTFYRQFKKYRGCMPEEYRKRLAKYKYKNPYTMVSDNAYEILYYIVCHFKNDISLSNLCKDLYVTEQSVNAILKQHFNVTYHEMVNVFRIRYAQALLLASDMVLEDLSLCCGFHSVHTFIRVFKEENNLTPTEYRKKYKEPFYE